MRRVVPVLALAAAVALGVVLFPPAHQALDARCPCCGCQAARGVAMGQLLRGGQPVADIYTCDRHYVGLHPSLVAHQWLVWRDGERP